MCQLCDKLKELKVNDAYTEYFKEKNNIDEEHRKEISEELAARYHDEVISYGACTD